MKQHTETGERGNVLFMILMAVALIAMLTRVVSKGSEQQADTLDREKNNDEISRLINYTSILGMALNQMVINGQEPTTLYSTLSALKIGDAGYDTAPHDTKIFHPMGGGVSYSSASSMSASAIATGYKINKGSIITGVGETDAVVGDVVFVAKISALEHCQTLNTLLTGAATVPVLATATFDALFTAGTTVTVDGTNCADCVNNAKFCVTNTGGTEWGYYAALLPG